MGNGLSLWRRAAAEGFAAFALVFAGCGAIVADAEYDGALGAVGVSLTFGLIIMAMIYATGHLSGAHINPAVTVAFTLTRHFAILEAEDGGVGVRIERVEYDAAAVAREVAAAGLPSEFADKLLIAA